MSIIMLKNILTFKSDSVFTAALAAVMLLLGYWVKGKSPALRKYCIPAPVVGGFLFMFITFIGHQTGAPTGSNSTPTSRTPSCWPSSPPWAWVPASPC